MAGTYSLPNDGEEQARLDMQHVLWKIVLDDALGLAPVCNEAPAFVLDVGTGTGAWANEFAERNPTSEVIGTDLSLIQPSIAPNVTFVVEDSEEDDWVFPQLFDYIHLRSMLVSLNDVTTILRRSLDHMNPGAWLEFQDSSWELHSPNGSLEGTAIQRWSQCVLEGLARNGHDTVLNLQSLKSHLESVGFVDVQEKTFPVPGNGWMKRKPKMKHLGIFTGSIIVQALDAYRKVLGFAGLSDGEIDELIEAAKLEVGNTNIHFYLRIHCVFGRKPIPDS
ncbi:hypothetical protein PFICI_05214 [Pestalotiopsis fici W106-1]|uniref:Methyltransferase domain-containing protein n=1 Tax=Pestalotiopsis fici (strain W106-1 / CGMCC3.15140) TaxID=1229662 RepID=W3XB80_PESFW|nr:uncharacterized protein PFICI_05214 [Pestalotiopsis fici W106-1]ETS83338.1 hypothetical protein PFICI_05214 [Pestalotiopsis fici W106-1]